jgi:hypothetical protein
VSYGLAEQVVDSDGTAVGGVDVEEEPGTLARRASSTYLRVKSVI